MIYSYYREDGRANEKWKDEEWEDERIEQEMLGERNWIDEVT